MPYDQRAEVRPISFVLHNQAIGAAPFKLDLLIRPEDLTRNDVSRLTTHQTLGGAWSDNFGPGVPTVSISGHTGWGQGGRPDGHEAFLTLHATVFNEWHKQRADAIDANLDPELVKLIFLDTLDRFAWVVSPQNFILKRNKSRPLLSQYQITLNRVAEDSIERVASILPTQAELKSDGLASLEDSISKIEAMASELAGGISAALAPVQKAFADFCNLTARVLNVVKRAIKAGMGIVNAVTGPLLNIAANLARAGANIARAIQSVLSIPQLIKAKLSRVASAFTNAFCVLRNVFKARQFITNYDDIYGASTCSSTAGGRPLSRYTTENPFPTLFASGDPRVSASRGALTALNRSSRLDVVQSPPAVPQLNADMMAMSGGISV